MSSRSTRAGHPSQVVSSTNLKVCPRYLPNCRTCCDTIKTGSRIDSIDSCVPRTCTFCRAFRVTVSPSSAGVKEVGPGGLTCHQFEVPIGCPGQLWLKREFWWHSLKLHLGSRLLWGIFFFYMYHFQNPSFLFFAKKYTSGTQQTETEGPKMALKVCLTL